MVAIYNIGFSMSEQQHMKNITFIFSIMICFILFCGFTLAEETSKQRALDNMDKYQLKIKKIVDSNYQYLHRSSEDKNGIETIFVITIEPDGKVTEIKFEKRSGIKELDDAGYRAIIKSIPFPPLPKSYTKQNFKLGFIFTPNWL